MYTPEQVREIADKACRYDNSRYQPWSDSNSPHYGDAEHFVRRVLDCLAERAAPAVAYRLETDGHITYWPESWQVERERKNLQTLGYPAKVTPLYEHPQSWKVAFDAQREAAMRAHAICYETMLSHPEVAELGDDGRLHDAIHDILRVDLEAATLRQQAARVDEEMVERAVAAYRRTTHAMPQTQHDRMRAAIEAAISAKPAERQGEAVAWLHTVTQGDGETDHALSFSPDSFPLDTQLGFRSLGCRPLGYIDTHLATRALSAEKAGWRDVDSAPKDGTDILATDGTAMLVTYWHGGSIGWLYSYSDHDVAGWHPTHWMPLPASPTDGEE